MTEDPKSIRKKTETIEIRVPLDVKTALKKRAATEKKSVSEALRELIGAYILDGKEALPKRRISLGWLGSGILAVAGVGLFSSAVAIADPISLNIQGEFKDTSQDVHNISRFSSSVDLAEGEVGDLQFGKNNEHKITLKVSETDDGQYFVEIEIFDGQSPDSDAVANPKILIEQEHSGTISIDQGQGKSYTMVIEAGE